MKPSSATLAALGGMMFVQYASMGAAFSTLGLVMGAHGMAAYIGGVFAVGGFVTIFSPVFFGMLADRFVSAERLLTVLNAVCAVALLGLAVAVEHRALPAFFLLTALFYSTFVPATALANRITFQAIGPDHKRFTYVRTCGTFGYMVGAFVIGQTGLSASLHTFHVAAGAAVVAATLGFVVPQTPPVTAGTPLRISELFGMDALSLLRIPSYRIFLLSTVLLFVPMMAHLSYLSLFLGVQEYSHVGTYMAIGPVSELVCMTFLAFLLTKWGFKNALLLACSAWTVRMLLFAYGASHAATALVVAAIVIHGVAWDFFFVTGEIYTNEMAGPAIKAQAQGLWRTMTFGLGVTVGSMATGFIFNRVVTLQGPAGAALWQRFWLYPAFFSALAGIILLARFRNPASTMPLEPTILPTKLVPVESVSL